MILLKELKIEAAASIPDGAPQRAAGSKAPPDGEPSGMSNREIEKQPFHPARRRRHETHLSAQHDPAETDTRVSRPHENPRWKESLEPTEGKGAKQADGLTRDPSCAL